MDLKTASALRRLRLISVPETVSFLLLLVCSVLKRTTDFNAVPVMGRIHGVLFVLYAVFWAIAWYRTRWPLGRAALYFAYTAVVPAGGFYADRLLRREAEASVIAARARAEQAKSAADLPRTGKVEA